MKKLFFSSLILIVSLVCLTSCETVAVAAEVPVSTEVVWYDTNNNLTVVYINDIANYRYWDAVYSRYYYRPVPHYRYRYICRRPPIHHHHARPFPPRHHGSWHHIPGNPHRYSPHINSSIRHMGGNMNRPFGGRTGHNSHGHFGGRR